MLPEVAANWAYPQAEMTPEESAFTLVTGLASRFYLSGHLNRMSSSQLDLVTEAVLAAKSIRSALVVSSPSWPAGLPGWDDRWIASALHAPGQILLSLWDRGDGLGEIALEFPALKGQDLSINTVFPRTLPVWDTRWNAETGKLTVLSTVTTPSARTLSLTLSAPSV
jgi:alpha-galactosidase